MPLPSPQTTKAHPVSNGAARDVWWSLGGLWILLCPPTLEQYPYPTFCLLRSLHWHVLHGRPPRRTGRGTLRGPHCPARSRMCLCSSGSWSQPGSCMQHYSNKYSKNTSFNIILVTVVTLTILPTIVMSKILIIPAPALEIQQCTGRSFMVIFTKLTFFSTFFQNFHKWSHAKLKSRTIRHDLLGERGVEPQGRVGNNRTHNNSSKQQPQ